MIERLQKKYSLRVENYFTEMQAKVLENPQYFGVCPLPGIVDTCPIHHALGRQVMAIKKEILLRSLGD
jgi:hypothetical protein